MTPSAARAPRAPRVLLAIGFALALAPTVRADDAPSPASAPRAPTLRVEDFDLLPLDETPRQQLYLDNLPLIESLTGLRKRAEGLVGRLRERPNQADAGSDAARAELADVTSKMAPMLVELEGLLAKQGVTPEQIARLRDAPKGPYREERYAHEAVRRLGSLSAEQRAVFERVVPAVEGAYFALLAQRERLRRPSDGGDAAGDRATSDRLTESVEAQLRTMERRFWRLVDYTLSSEQKREVRRFLPGKLRKFENGIQHVFLLPGLTPSQGAQLKALLIEIDSEAAPETSEAKRLEQEAKDGSLSGAERAAKQGELHAVQRRVLALQIDAVRRAKEILTPEQFAEYEAIPPLVTAQDRSEQLKGVLSRMDLSPEQAAKIRDLVARNESKKHELERGYQDVQRMKSDVSPESPKQTTMEMMMAAVGSRVQLALRAAGNELFLEILTPQQVAGWVLTLAGTD